MAPPSCIGVTMAVKTVPKGLVMGTNLPRRRVASVCLPTPRALRTIVGPDTLSYLSLAAFLERIAHTIGSQRREHTCKRRSPPS